MADQSKHDPLLKNCHLSIWLPETPTTAQNTGNNFEGKITFNNVRLSAAKVRFAQSKFSYLQDSGGKDKRENVSLKQIPRSRAYESGFFLT